MPIKIPDNLPARQQLVDDGIAVMANSRAASQDIRPLQIGLLNLMPDKPTTELQFARLLGASCLQVDLTLIRVGGHVAKNTPIEHLEAFYASWQEVESKKFDGLIVTGAPLEKIQYEDVTYWNQLQEIFAWTESNVYSTMFVCWGAMAAARHFYGVEKVAASEKAFGVFPHNVRVPQHPLCVGLSDCPEIPVSRWVHLDRKHLAGIAELETLIESDDTGICLAANVGATQIYMLNHLEYDAQTLSNEYRRDLKRDPSTTLPRNYYPEDDSSKKPLNRWRSDAQVLFRNWINLVYSQTPFDLTDIGNSSHRIDLDHLGGLEVGPSEFEST